MGNEKVNAFYESVVKYNILGGFLVVFAKWGFAESNFFYFS